MVGMPDQVAGLLAGAADAASSRAVMRALEEELRTLEVGGALNGKVRSSSAVKLPIQVARELWNSYGHVLPPALRSRWSSAAGRKGRAAQGRMDNASLGQFGDAMPYSSMPVRSTISVAALPASSQVIPLGGMLGEDEGGVRHVGRVEVGKLELVRGRNGRMDAGGIRALGKERQRLWMAGFIPALWLCICFSGTRFVSRPRRGRA